MNCLEAKDFKFGYSQKPVVEGELIRIVPGAVTVLLGPNGAGKTTFLRGITRSIKPMKGSVTLDGVDIWKINGKKFASRVARVSQNIETTWPYTVFDFIALGRYPYSGILPSSLSSQDLKQVTDIINDTDLSKYSNTEIDTLSGGEFQRVMFARALCQNPDYLILDEPAAHLDLHYRVAILEEIEKQKNKNRGICISMHNLNYAARIADIIYILHEGSVFTKGTSEEVLTKETIEHVYRTKVRIIHSKNDILIHPA